MKRTLDTARAFRARCLSFLLTGVLLAGCFGKKRHPELQPANAYAGEKVVVAPPSALNGRVAMVNTSARFVILSFPVGHVPATDQRVFLYRAGSKVGEVKVTGPQYDDNIVADLLAGEAQVGDQVRDK